MQRKIRERLRGDRHDSEESAENEGLHRFWGDFQRCPRFTKKVEDDDEEYPQSDQARFHEHFHIFAFTVRDEAIVIHLAGGMESRIGRFRIGAESASENRVRLRGFQSAFPNFIASVQPCRERFGDRSQPCQRRRGRSDKQHEEDRKTENGRQHR